MNEKATLCKYIFHTTVIKKRKEKKSIATYSLK